MPDGLCLHAVREKASVHAYVWCMGLQRLVGVCLAVPLGIVTLNLSPALMLLASRSPPQIACTDLIQANLMFKFVFLLAPVWQYHYAALTSVLVHRIDQFTSRTAARNCTVLHSFPQVPPHTLFCSR